MLNMSNQFFNYISNKISEFMIDVNPGERYYFQLEKKEHVDNIYEALRENDNSRIFNYQHGSGSVYESFFLEGKSKVIIAATLGDIKPDYLVTLRNLISEQTGVWNGTSILFITDSTLDSIKGGCTDLQKNGMPLSISEITKNIKDELESSSLKNYEKSVIEFYLSRMDEEEYYQPDLWEYGDILSILSEGEILDNQYKEIGVFKDPSLGTYTKSEQKKRLIDNHNYFELVQKAHQYDDIEVKLSKIFGQNGVNKFSDENWQELLYQDVINSRDELNSEKTYELRYLGNDEKQSEGSVYYWERPNSDTKAGERTRNIIVFNSENQDKIEFKFKFDDHLKKEYLKKKIGYNTISVSGKSLHLVINTNEHNTEFHRIEYKHKDSNSSKFIFNIAVVKFDYHFTESFKTHFTIDAKNKLIKIDTKDSEITIGPSTQEKNRVEIDQNGALIEIANNLGSILINENNVEDVLCFKLVIENSIVPVQWKAYSKQIHPISSDKIWNIKREKQDDFIYDDETHKIKIGTEEFSTYEEMRKYYYFEKEMILRKRLFIRVEGAEIIDCDDIEIDNELEKKYFKVLNWFESRNNIPTFTYVTNDGIKLVNDFLEEYVKNVEEIKDKSILTKQQINLSKLGMAYNSEYIYMTPFHPVMLAYQIQSNNEIGNEPIEVSLLERLNPVNLMPFIFGKNSKVYKSQSMTNREWVEYETIENATVGETNRYLAYIVEEKLEQFTKHFKHLFIEGSNAPFMINVIGIRDDKELVKGILNFLLKGIAAKGLNGIFPFKISLYNEESFVSELEVLSTFTDFDEILERYDISPINSKIDPIDITRVLKESIMYSKKRIGDSYSYAHITFFKMYADKKFTNVNQEEIETGLSLSGLMSTLPAVENGNSYRSGYGVKNLHNSEELFYRIMNSANELMANMDHDGNNVYQKKIAIASVITEFDKKMLDKIYDSSHWITFIDPNVGFDFFTRNEEELVIIHYSDQYSTSAKLDAITVTKKINQYENVLKKFLYDNRVYCSNSEISKTIQDFNTMNGEWLLRMVSRSNKSEFTREKLSILSAVKVLLGYLEHPNIAWIPVSLEEILRVAGAVKLKKSEGLFSAKNLGSSGAHSDDLLMIGLEDQGERALIHFYPVEVKVGNNYPDVMSKARTQVMKTASLFKEHLSTEIDTDYPFRGKIYRNFFIQVLLSNFEKIKSKKLYTLKDKEFIEKWRKYILDDDYEVDFSLENYIGCGAVVSFKNNSSIRSVVIDKDISFIHMTEQDAYNGVVKNQADVVAGIQDGSYGFLTNKLLSSTYEPGTYVYPHYSEETKQVADIKLTDYKDVEEEDNNKTSDLPNTDDMTNKETPEEKSLYDVRLLIGTAENSTKKIFWEYGHKNLSNRHVLISGKSGQGKSYLIQCLLLELSKSGVSSIIIDYTDGFKKSKLEPEFRDALGDGLEQFIVAHKKFPVNPFKRNKKELDEDLVIDEDDTDIAERIKSVFGSVYKTLGIQQLNSIYEAVMRGLKVHGNHMNLSYLLEELEADTSSYAKTASSTIKPLIDKNPFDNTSTFNWGDVFKTKGKVFIIQLTGYMRDVQLIIAEFILWDLWNYKLQTGNQKNPFSVIMDEAQNLDHSEKSPSAKVLTEGRKFGWSGWYATQFMKGQMSSDEIMRLQNSAQKIYFSPPEGEISSIASNITNDPVDRKYWENKLKNLQKGQCIFVGATRNSDGSLMPSKTAVVDIDSLSSRE